MALKFGGSNAAALKFGSANVAKIYHGSSVVYQPVSGGPVASPIYRFTEFTGNDVATSTTNRNVVQSPSGYNGLGVWIWDRDATGSSRRIKAVTDLDANANYFGEASYINQNDPDQARIQGSYGAHFTTRGRENTTGRTYKALTLADAAYQALGVHSTAANGICNFSKTSASTTYSFPHYLGVNPELIFARITGGAATTTQYYVSGSAVGTGKYLHMATTAEAQSSTGISWNSSSVVFNGGIPELNTDAGVSCGGYVFTSVPGKSKIGNYTGTGAIQTVDIGFQPVFVLVKTVTGGTSNWEVLTKGYNTVGNPDVALFNSPGTADTLADTRYEIVPNGFKLLSPSSVGYGAGVISLYMAFG